MKVSLFRADGRSSPVEITGNQVANPDGLILCAQVAKEDTHMIPYIDARKPMAIIALFEVTGFPDTEKVASPCEPKPPKPPKKSR